MFSGFATKIALKKLGIPSIPSDPFNLSSTEPEPRKPNKLTKTNPGASLDSNPDDKSANWPAWMSIKSLPLSVQPWLTPVPPPIPVAEPPKIGDLAPMDRDRELVLGRGKMVLVVFLRCVGCAFAQKTFLHLRALATRYPNELTCIAVSHSSPVATKKWLDLVGGAWGVQVIVDEDRSIYAAWGLGLGNFLYLFHPASQVAGFKEKGWLGATVVGSLQRTGAVADAQPRAAAAGADAAATGSPEYEGPNNLMGNKWQQAGAWAVDGRGRIVWGGKALRADDVMDLDAGVDALGLGA
ncbi:hypothetical protein B0T19DRAFT_37197 [Cercophora scortea]|uniref:Alkyl hydroperoxide reductase subunit C/ Thiol specific antioxidant domain-containing protein n=1 Tax=Cercophora scortea TaxID=314031 RepID=A0AAE0J3V9_9PEZI|nr:hypothetical protein B0T19DRAFT_37197 [Cercophora scortea]